MIFKPLTLSGAFLIKLTKISDQRGFFLRSWCKETFEKEDISCNFTQFNISFNPFKNTLRGMHFQIAPHEEVKLIQCVQGSIFDVIIDLRKDSKTYMQHYSVVLSSSDPHLLFVPQGFAHGFLTLENTSCVLYHMAEASYSSKSSRGLLWNDPALKIAWPDAPIHISEKDKSWKPIT